MTRFLVTFLIMMGTSCLAHADLLALVVARHALAVEGGARGAEPRRFRGRCRFLHTGDWYGQPLQRRSCCRAEKPWRCL